MCSTQEAGKREAPGVNGRTPEGHAKANFPRKQDALHVDGRTLEGQTTANQAHHSQEVLVVSPTSSYYVEGRVGNHPAQVLIDTGSALTLVRTDHWNRTVMAAQQLQPVDQRLVWA